MDDCCFEHQVIKTLKRIRTEARANQAEVRVMYDEVLIELRRLGAQMSEVTDLLADLDAATTATGAKIDAQTAKIVDLAQQLADALPGSDEAVQLRAALDEAKAAITVETDRLRGFAADPENPVPPVEEPPVDNGGGDNIPPLD
jgi:uncharacterized phage infection (PIP) family protein YhgE